MGRVHEIVVENFKSYQGRVHIGPFRKFTCVIGPNGAGKSNLMDAMSFVLGIQARQLRSERLRDLVYRTEGEDPKKNQRTAFVELTYMGGEGYEVEDATETLVFRRTILRTGEARFEVNGEAMSQADYHQRLESINILSKVRNFLVFQGDVEATARRQGKDLTAFFEQISGSEAYRQEYERLAAEKAKKEDNARFLFTKKRNAINERKRVEHQKDEADEYRRLEAEKRNLHREFFMFRLHGIARQLEDTGRARGEAQGECGGLQAELEAGRQEIEAAERERAQAHLSSTQAERAAVAARAKLDRLNPERVSARSRLAFLQGRVQDLHQNSEKDEKKNRQIEGQIEALQEEQAKLEAEERAIGERVAQRELHFTPEQREEFDRLKKETARITAAGGDRVRQLEQQIRTTAAEKTKAEGDFREAAGRRSHLQKRISELKEAEETVRAAHERESARAEQRSAEFARLRGSAVSCEEEKEQLHYERQQLLDTIQDGTATERQLERERELTQVTESLMSAVPGVYGRVVDLCVPSQKRLHVSVNVAIGRYLDAVIVDTSATARQCVRYLKERMFAPMTFLPLNDLRSPQPDPRLEAVVNSHRALRLALTCVSFDEQYAKAFEFLLGDTVIADTMTDARQLAFGDLKNLGLSCKLVTLAGESIAKNGNLSVNSDATREGATKFDLTELDTSKKRIETIDRRLHVIHATETSSTADLSALQDEVRRLESKAHEAKTQLHWCQEQLKQKVEDLSGVEAAIESLDPEAARLSLEEGRLREEQRSVEERLGKAVSSHFARLSAAMGVDDVRKLEREWQKEREAGQARNDQLTRRLRNVKAELVMLTTTLKERVSSAPEDALSKLQAEIAQLSEKEATCARSGDALEAERKEHERKVKECLEREREKEKSLSGLRQVAKTKRQQLMAVEKRLGDLGSAEQSLLDARVDTLRQSVLEDVEVPMFRGGLEALQDLAEAPSQAASAPTQEGPAAAMESAANIAVDFALLPQEKQAASSGPAAKMLEDEYRAELDRLRVELERLSPNLKAIDQMQGVAENVQAASSEADVARKDIEDIESQFEAVRSARKEKFFDCFKKVAGEIGEVYRRLTANTAGLHADGGSAYLDLEDPEEPFNSGIKFTAMPPAKRFRDMHLLSGGEKTLAAMALLFAIHTYQKPPFMVLDEVDAALDANNVRALAGYVEQADCQTIVISLKDRFFIRSEALVGVWKNKPLETSAVLTLDLTQYLPGQVQ